MQRPRPYSLLSKLSSSNTAWLTLPSYVVLVLNTNTPLWGFPGGSAVKNLPASPGVTDSICESGRAPGEGNDNPSSILAREIPRTEKLGGLQSMGSQIVGYNLVSNQQHKAFLTSPQLEIAFPSDLTRFFLFEVSGIVWHFMACLVILHVAIYSTLLLIVWKFTRVGLFLLFFCTLFIIPRKAHWRLCILSYYLLSLKIGNDNAFLANEGGLCQMIAWGHFQHLDQCLWSPDGECWI